MMRIGLFVWVVAACSTSPAQEPAPSIVAITACPDGAVLVGDAPPRGLRQRCQKSDAERHGASREWYEDRRERNYSEWWDGEKHGRFAMRFKNGKLRSEGAHRFGAPAGEWKYYNEDGSLRQQEKFPVEPPPADWLAQALAGHPPVTEPRPAGAAAPSVAAPAEDGW